MSYTKVEIPTVNRFTKISVRPFFEERENMGLEKYSMTLFDGVMHEEQLACIEDNGITRYITGLNEFAPEVKKLKGDAKEAKIKEIRKVVSELEQELANNIVDAEDKDFWNKVELLKPNNAEFWNQVTLRAGNEPVFLDPENNPHDLIKYYAILAGGFSMVGKSFEDAKSKARPPKFYLDRLEETLTVKNEIKKTRNKALSELEKLSNKSSKKLFYVAKVVDANSAQYRGNTPKEVIYDNMDSYINGEGIEQNKMRAADTFITAASMDLEDLIIKAIIKDASFNKFILLKSDGFIYDAATSTMLGRNPEDVFEYFKNPLNDEIFKEIKDRVDEFINS
jgi:hypothetical protein